VEYAILQAGFAISGISHRISEVLRLPLQRHCCARRTPTTQTVSPLFSMPIAFKEWAVTVRALAEGEQLLTLRKGGIREPEKHFKLD
jgi:hypothetical protein